MVHGEHWGAVLARKDRMPEILPRLVQKGQPLAVGPIGGAGDDGIESTPQGLAITYPDTPLRFLGLVALSTAGANQFVNGYPFCAEGVESELKITEVLEDPDGDVMEGGLEVESKEGWMLSFADPVFFANRHRYVPGEVIRFSLAGLAHTIAPATMSFRVTDGQFIESHRRALMKVDPNVRPEDIEEVEFSLSGARMLIPDFEMPLFGSSYRSPVAAVEEFMLEDIPMTRLLISPLGDDESSLPMWLYAAPHVLAGYQPKVGDEVEGFAWIQGHPAP